MGRGGAEAGRAGRGGEGRGGEGQDEEDVHAATEEQLLPQYPPQRWRCRYHPQPQQPQPQEQQAEQTEQPELPEEQQHGQGEEPHVPPGDQVEELQVALAVILSSAPDTRGPGAGGEFCTCSSARTIHAGAPASDMLARSRPCHPVETIALAPAVFRRVVVRCTSMASQHGPYSVPGV